MRKIKLFKRKGCQFWAVLGCTFTLLSNLSYAGGNSFTGWSPFQLPPLKVVTCQALLEMHPNSPRDRLNPLVSLRELQGYLQKYAEISPAETIGHYNPFSIQKQSLETTKIPRDKVLEALGRLMVLEDDTTTVNFNGTYVYNEVRGWNQVQLLSSQLEDYFFQTEAEVAKELKRSLPLLRLQTSVDSLVAYIGYSALSAISDLGHLNTDLFVESAILSIGTALYLSSRGIQKSMSLDRNFLNHLDVIKLALKNKGEGYPISIYGDSMTVSTEFHEELMQTTGSPEDVGVESSAKEVRLQLMNFFDYIPGEILRIRSEFGSLENYHIEMTKRFPEGKSRQVYTDQLFYIDPTTSEPVWLFYFRSFKSKPIAPKKPKKSTTNIKNQLEELSTPSKLRPVPIK